MDQKTEETIYHIFTISEVVIIALLFITSIVRNLDGFMYVIIILLMVVVSALSFFMIRTGPESFKYPIIYPITICGIVISDLLNFIAAVFLPLLFCYITFTLTVCFKIFVLFLLHFSRENKDSIQLKDESIADTKESTWESLKNLVQNFLRRKEEDKKPSQSKAPENNLNIQNQKQ